MVTAACIVGNRVWEGGGLGLVNGSRSGLCPGIDFGINWVKPFDSTMQC